jgi:SanA protein
MKKILQCRKGFVVAGIALMLLMILPFSSSILMRAYSGEYTYDDIAKVPDKTVALVLGAAAYPSRLSDILQDRVDTAIELYNAKKVIKIIMSGSPSEAKAMSAYAIKKGIPENDIVEDDKGLSTFESVKNADNIADMVIVTQSFHMPRSIYLARHSGIDAVGMTSDKHQYTKIFDFTKREILASSKAMIDLLFK